MNKKLILILALSLNIELNARHGGAIAGGILGGMFLGSMLTRASEPRTVYVDRNNQDDYYQQTQPIVREIHYVRVDPADTITSAGGTTQDYQEK